MQSQRSLSAESWRPEWVGGGVAIKAKGEKAMWGLEPRNVNSVQKKTQGAESPQGPPEGTRRANPRKVSPIRLMWTSGLGNRVR